MQRTFAHVLDERAQLTPDRLAYGFLDSDGGDAERLSYAELARWAQGVAAALVERCAPGDRALLLFPTGPEFLAAFFACQWAGVVAVPLSPPHPARFERAVERLRAVAQDARPAVVLSSRALAEAARAVDDGAGALPQVPWLVVDAAQPHPSAALAPQTTEFAFLQYTSGSTGAPKGVVVSHASLLANEATIQRTFSLSAQSVVVSWLPLYHDMGFIGFALQPMFAGFPAWLMAPTTFLMRPVTWLRAITRHGGTISGGPDFAYELCARRVREEDKAALDLASWNRALNGAEPVRARTVDAFTAAFAASRFKPGAFFPCYGLAEATLLVSGHKGDDAPARLQVDGAALEQHRVQPVSAETAGAVALVSNGRALDADVVAVEPGARAVLPPDAVGELWVRAPTAPRAYWGKPAESAETFEARLADGGGPFLRTGDLGFVADGEVYVTGRLKDLIILAGRNLYPHDLEAAAVRAHPSVRPDGVAAVSVDGESGEQLVLLVEVERRALDRSARLSGGAKSYERGPVIAAIRKAIAEQFDVAAAQVVLLIPGTLPKTTSGKLQRRAARARFVADGYRDAAVD